jgi:phosphopantothenoylcysteine decarboxylase/phosphopantothenate--cysteine ligase
VVLAVSGGIACYKSVALARELTRRGARVEVILTEAAGEFVRPLVFEGVTGRPVLDSLWSAEGSARHLRLAREADVLLVAPATADLLARAAQGRAQDLVTTVLLATRAPVLMAPAMNDLMWAHPQVQANARHLAQVLGYRLVGPDEGPLAAGEGEGPGRMVEPEVLVREVGRALASSGSALAGVPVLVTAGPTREPLDGVRTLTNRSSGTMGYALAAEAWLRGAEVTMVSGPTSLPDPHGVRVVRVETAREMAQAAREAAGEAGGRGAEEAPRPPGAQPARRPARLAPGVHLLAAAVADFRPATVHQGKWKKAPGARVPPPLAFEENPDVAAAALEGAPSHPRPPLRLGFALEAEGLEDHAREKLAARGFDWIVANPAGEADAGFESSTNRGILLGRDGSQEELRLQEKESLARLLLDRVEARLRALDTPPLAGGEGRGGADGVPRNETGGGAHGGAGGEAAAGSGDQAREGVGA